MNFILLKKFILIQQYECLFIRISLKNKNELLALLIF